MLIKRFLAVFICIQDPEESEEDNSVHEPPRKVPKVSARLGLGSKSIKLLRVKEEARVLTDGDLRKLYAVYVANKARQQVAEAPVSTAGVAYPIPNRIAAAAAAGAPSTPITSSHITPIQMSTSASATSNAVNMNSPNGDSPMTFTNNERVTTSGAFQSTIPGYTTSAKALL